MAKKRHTSKTSADKRNSRASTPVWIWIGLGVLIVVAAIFVLVRPKSAVPAEVSAVQAYEKYQAGAFFLDVRTRAEWDQGHIDKSVLIPLDELPSRLSEVPRDQYVIVVCRSGARSKEGATILRQAGYTQVSCLTGGLQAWVAAGHDVVR
jgi:rhodanese-related sulfurtransferase